MDSLPPPIVAQEIQIVDAQGHPVLRLSGASGRPVVEFLRQDGAQGLALSLDDAGRPSVMLANPDAALPTASLEIDDKGAHVKFDRPGGASSYLFLNNTGGSGVVLFGPTGDRRLDILAAPDGTTTVQRYGSNGQPLP
ncbi:hypothetical protein EPK99_05915 [Neorhizobium lilium]|uniref:Uncharacterized protein n=1 Tax=Neorhizobium lilium TaxID=2503024 RepID=A0A3S3RQ93_9HYPH|nr:hypothetical protein [Neorhizobium lilium]RWX81787.1 hypothetical protein EPK99_05915 [Neorhizobium lilium]